MSSPATVSASSKNMHIRWDLQMLTPKPAYKASTKEERRRLCSLLTNTQLQFAHKLTHDSSLFSFCLKGQWGWEKPTGQQAGKEWGSSPHLALWALLKGDLLQMSPSAKSALKGAERDTKSDLLPRAQVSRAPYRMAGSQSAEQTGFPLSSISKHYGTTPGEEEKVRHPQVETKVRVLDCSVHTVIYLININSSPTDLRQDSPRKSNITKMVRPILVYPHSY